MLKINALQFLDLMKEVVDISEFEGSELTDELVVYLNAKGMTFETLKPYLRFYPDRIYKNKFLVIPTAYIDNSFPAIVGVFFDLILCDIPPLCD